MRKKKVIVFSTDECIQSTNNEKHCHICKIKFQYVDESDGCSDDNSIMMIYLTAESFMVMLWNLILMLMIIMVMTTNLMIRDCTMSV